MQLEEIQENLERIRIDIDNTFKLLNTPDNIIIKKDPYYGKRSVTVTLRLDELSIIKLKEFVPKLESLMEQFKNLRQNETEIVDQMLIKKSIENSNLNNFQYPKY